MATYWQDRAADTLKNLSTKNQKQIEKQLKKYYGKSMERVINDFENTYNKVLANQVEGVDPTPADLYKLDTYWKMQGQLKKELNKLGDKQISVMSKIFEINFFDVYYSIALEGLEAYTTVSSEGAMALINSVWVADGKNWSTRVWENTNELASVLNDELINVLITGKKTTELKKQLQEKFAVNYYRADTLARTELSHIQNTAAQQRYKDYGVKEVQIWADYDERRCDVCGALHKKIIPVNDPVPIPAHPNCRCSIVPIVK